MPRSLRRPDLGLWLLGAGLLLAYGVLWLWPFWLGSNEYDEVASYVGSLLGYTWRGFGRFVLACVVPSVLYLLALRLLPRVPRERALPAAVCVTVLAPLLLLATYPVLAADVFGSLMYGRIISEHGANPYATTPIHFQGDPYLATIGNDWIDLPAIYGPVWLWVSAGATEVAGEDVVLAMLLLKIVAVAAHIGTAALIYRITLRLAPERALQALVAYGWNPFVVVHLAADAHNDALMLLFLVGALHLALLDRWRGAFPLLALATLTKFVPALLGPVFLLAARRHPRQAATGVAISLLLAVVVYAPLWTGLDTFDGVRQQSALFTSSPASLLRYVLHDSWLRPLMTTLFGIGYLVILWRVRGLTMRGYGVLMLYLWTLSFWTKGWYFSWVLTFGSILGGWPLAAAIAAGFGVFLQNATAWGWEMNWFGWRDRYGTRMWELWLMGTMYVPWLVVGLAALSARWRARGPKRG
jgi:hypothetical protein